MNNLPPDKKRQVDAAWKAMKLLLDEELPVAPDAARVFPFWTKVAASVLILLFISYGTTRPYHRPPGPAAEGISFPTDEGPTASPLKMAAESQQRGIPGRPGRATFLRVVGTEGSAIAESKEAGSPEEVATVMPEVPGEVAVKSLMVAADSVNAGRKDSLLLPALSKNKSMSSALSLSVGVGYHGNTSFRGLHPVASLRIPLGKRSGLSVGVALNAVVAVEGVPSREVVFVQDPARGVQFELNQTRVNEACYIDLPVEFSCKIGGQLSVSTGVQLSVLQRSKRIVEKTEYGFSADPSRVVSSLFAVGAVPANQSYEEEFQENKADYRAVAGLSYRWQKVSVKVKYQHGLAHAFAVKDFEARWHKNKNRVFSIDLTYNLLKKGS